DFAGGTDTQFHTALQALLNEGAKKQLFDVRFNPGGSVNVQSNMLDELLPEGTIISLKPKSGEGGETYTSDANEIDLPMAVLVNADSISAAEFFPAALQEYGKAVIVGDKTIGKGYSQRQYPLSDGAALILSDQLYYTPKGKNLAGVGITPDVQVSLPEDQYKNFEFLEPADDDQLQAAIKALEK
ncbi:MAG: S41 family peptidase, partial [Intestinibacillus sp.]